MAEDAAGPKQGNRDPVNHVEGGRQPGQRYPATEAHRAALEDDLHRRVQQAAELYARGDYANARQWAAGAEFATSAYDDSRLAAYAVEAALIAGRSSMAMGDPHLAHHGLSRAYTHLTEGPVPLPDAERRMLADTVHADLKRLQTHFEEAARTAPPADAVAHLRNAEAIERLRPGTGQRLRELRTELLHRQTEWAESLPDSPQRAAVEYTAMRSAADLLDGVDLDLAGPGMRPVAHTYAELARRRLAAGAFTAEDDLIDLADRLRGTVRYLERGDAVGERSSETAETYLALRDTAQAHAQWLADLALWEEGPTRLGEAVRDGEARRGEARERRDLLREAWGISQEVEADNPARRAADSYLLLRALADGPETEPGEEAGEQRRNWADAEVMFHRLPRELARHFGAHDPRVRDAAEALADMSARRAEAPGVGLREAAALLRAAEGHQLFAVRAEAAARRAAGGADAGGRAAATGTAGTAAPAGTAGADPLPLSTRTVTSAQRLQDLRTRGAEVLARKNDAVGPTALRGAAPAAHRSAALAKLQARGAAVFPDPRLSGRSALRPPWQHPGAGRTLGR
ncbi:hypothetical protein LG943_18010 [Streptomonospora sp. S1-112]|uniref:Uncharacterized protein n=1 Tax=Streptomonospora mangrovi TaxID=2883123 RepID=A0A9X3NXK8_9ACTN|nr:hypothetical protein [Streptomonospora mangrovi]MDA0566196.1 hypothetical protein [Streptomonospora mangrovi]